MNIPETYLQTSWDDAIDDVVLEDVEEIIEEITELDDESATFWVGIFEGNSEITLETNKQRTVIGTFEDGEEDEIEGQFDNWTEVLDLYKLFLAKDFEQVQAVLRAH